jgi:Protein of unknown function (DUF3828)
MKRFPNIVVMLAMLLGPLPATAIDSPQVFVQKFYAWYGPRISSGWARALKSKRSFFESTLANALVADADAQARNPSNIVGIDWDPFIGSQDPDSKYVAEKAIRTTTGYQVDVYGISGGKRRSKPDVRVDLTMHGGSWVITNFHYPTSGGDLLTSLRLLRQDREKNIRSPK